MPKKKESTVLNYKDILKRKAKRGDALAKQLLKELGDRPYFVNYIGS